MTGGAGGLYAQRCVVRIGGLVVRGHVAIGTIGRCAGVAAGVTIAAGSRYMSSRQREDGIVVVETSFGIAGRMALQAGDAGIGISAYFVMFVVGFLLVMVMAIDAGEDLIIGGIGMALRATGPCTCMFPGVNGE